VSDPLITLMCGAFIVLLVAGAELGRRWLEIPGRLTRLTVHVGSGALVALAPLIFSARWWPVGLAAAALVCLTVCRWQGWLPAIHAARPDSYGTSWFALATLILYLTAWSTPWLVTIPLLVMAFADAAGVILGERRYVLPLPEGFSGKSWDGSLAVFAVTGLTVTLGWEAFGRGSITEGLLIGLACASVGAVTEALSRRGTDNLTLPLAVAFTLLLIDGVPGQPGLILLVEGAAVLFALAAVKLRALRHDGAAGAFLIAVWLFSGGGWPWVTPLLTFFVLSSFLTLMTERIRTERPALEQKGGRRDLVQVGANGGVALLLFVLDRLGLPLYLSWPAFLGAVATAAADTWATEIGTTLRAEARLVTDFSRVPAGTSGGVTLNGTIAGALGSAVIAGVGVVLSTASDGGGLQLFAAAAVGGVVGMFADSLMGALWQGRWRCRVCGKITERREHCGKAVGERVAGLSWLDNDGVNAVAGLCGAVTAALLAAAL